MDFTVFVVQMIMEVLAEYKQRVFAAAFMIIGVVALVLGYFIVGAVVLLSGLGLFLYPAKTS